MQNDEEQLADLSALADGTIDPGRRDEVAARIAASSELTALYERERAVVDVLHRVRESDRAPAHLRRLIEEQRRPAGRARTRRRLTFGTAAATALAAAILAVVLALPAGTPGSPSVSQAAGVALRGPEGPPPAPDLSQPSAKLGQAVEDVYFPNWGKRFGWRAIGQRSDRIDDRKAVTVYYRWRGHTLAYTIVSAPALKEPAAQATRLNGTELRTLRLDGRLVVTWRRSGHTCVVSAKDVPVRELQRLAAWHVD